MRSLLPQSCQIALKLFTKLQHFQPVQIQRGADNKINVTQKLKIVFGKDEKHFEKRRKCWVPAFSPFLRLFSKVPFLGVV